MSTIFWVFVKDFKYFFQKDLGPYKDKKHARSEWVNLWSPRPSITAGRSSFRSWC
jgi:hypothetical protein